VEEGPPGAFLGRTVLVRGNTHSRVDEGSGLSVSGVPTALPTFLFFDYLLLREELTQLL
jgi:hypothetical protein